MKDILGEHIHTFYAENKKAEWADYIKHVTQWELDRYLAPSSTRGARQRFDGNGAGRGDPRPAPAHSSGTSEPGSGRIMHMKRVLVASDDAHTRAWVGQALAGLDVSASDCGIGEMQKRLIEGEHDLVVLDGGRNPEVLAQVVEHAVAGGVDLRLLAARRARGAGGAAAAGAGAERLLRARRLRRGARRSGARAAVAGRGGHQAGAHRASTTSR